MQWWMAGVSLGGIAFRPDCTWTPETLVFAGLLWAWSDEKTLIERFSHGTQDYHQLLRRAT